MKEKISVIYQDPEGRISGFSPVGTEEEIQAALNAGKSVFMDCDEDAFIVKDDNSALSFEPLQADNLPVGDLFPVVAMDEAGLVMMFAFASPEALRLTLERGFGHYYSRSRDKLWQKGEDSGHVQEIVDVLYNREKNLCVYVIRQKVAACHTGYLSCFYRQLQKGGVPSVVFSEKVFDPDSVYKG